MKARPSAEGLSDMATNAPASRRSGGIGARARPSRPRSAGGAKRLEAEPFRRRRVRAAVRGDGIAQGHRALLVGLVVRVPVVVHGVGEEEARRGELLEPGPPSRSSPGVSSVIAPTSTSGASSGRPGHAEVPVGDVDAVAGAEEIPAGPGDLVGFRPDEAPADVDPDRRRRGRRRGRRCGRPPSPGPSPCRASRMMSRRSRPSTTRYSRGEPLAPGASDSTMSEATSGPALARLIWTAETVLAACGSTPGT